VKDGAEGDRGRAEGGQLFHEPGEGAVVRDLLGGCDEASPRGACERTADADPSNAERGGLRDGEEGSSTKQVQR
jgi:hypothetical protein